MEETIRYIDSLHQKLLARVHTDGLPAKLTHHAVAASGKQPTSTVASEIKSCLESNCYRVGSHEEQ